MGLESPSPEQPSKTRRVVDSIRRVFKTITFTGRSIEDALTILKEVNEDEQTRLTDLLGEKAYTILKGKGAKFYPIKRDEDLPYVDREFLIYHMDRLIVIRGEILPTDKVMTVTGDWVTEPAKKTATIDFVHKEDVPELYAHPERYKKSAVHQDQDQKGVDFLQDMRTFVEAIDDKCQVTLMASDEQRQKIYTKAFARNENIHVSLADWNQE